MSIKKSNQPKSETQVAILEAYLFCCQAEGVEKVTLQKVAKQAKAAYGTVHYHFGGENVDLLCSALEYVAEVCERYVEEKLQPALSDPKKNALRTYVEAKLAWQEKHPAHASMLCYFIYQASRDPSSQAMSCMAHQHATGRMKAILLAEAGKGRYPGVVTRLDELAESLLLIIGGGQLGALGKSGAAAKAVVGLTWRMVEEQVSG